MLFIKNCLTVRRLDIHSKEAIVLNFGGPNEITVEIRSPNDSERKHGHKSFNAMCDTVGFFTPTPKALPVFKAISEGRLPPEGKKAKTAEDMTHTSGPHESLDYFPNPFSGYVDKIRTELSIYPKKTIRILRWRYAQQGPSFPISSRGSFFSFDKKSWFPIPARYSVTNISPPSSILKAGQINADEIVDLVQMESDEPLAHELYREAKELKFESPRSCLILAISSLEIRVKECIHRLIPDSEWLVKNLPAPPMLKILKEYFPLLPGKLKFHGKILPPPPELLNAIETGVNIRNDLAHKGTGTPKEETLDKVLDAVYDILWLCDFYCGFEWSKNYLNPKTLESLTKSP